MSVIRPLPFLGTWSLGRWNPGSWSSCGSTVRLGLLGRDLGERILLRTGQVVPAVDARHLARRVLADADGEVDHRVAGALGVEVVRRRSGGGAVLLLPGEFVWLDLVIPAGDPLWLDDVGQAAVDGGFGDKIGHAVQKQKSGPSGPPVTFGSFRFGP